VLHTFDGNDGDVPYGDVILDAAGNLYGTTLNGGDFSCPVTGGTGCGAIFQLTP
jgi:hypothetical protein